MPLKAICRRLPKKQRFECHSWTGISRILEPQSPMDFSTFPSLKDSVSKHWPLPIGVVIVHRWQSLYWSRHDCWFHSSSRLHCIWQKAEIDRRNGRSASPVQPQKSCPFLPIWCVLRQRPVAVREQWWSISFSYCHHFFQDQLAIGHALVNHSQRSSDCAYTSPAHLSR